ncbi:MAG: thioredoxin-dependent thiol peroxidase [Bacteroidota bacterium]
MATKKKAAAPVKKALTKTKTAKSTFKKHVCSLKSGDKAPVFSGVDQNGKGVALKDYKGKKLVLYFYPKDDTPGCTAQACSLRDDYASLKKKGVEILGVSADNEAKHQKFIDKYELPFRLLADTNHEVIKQYDVWGKKQFMGRIFDGLNRTTFLINEKGIIDHVIEQPDTKNHAEEIQKLWGI